LLNRRQRELQGTGELLAISAEQVLHISLNYQTLFVESLVQQAQRRRSILLQSQPNPATMKPSAAPLDHFRVKNTARDIIQVVKSIRRQDKRYPLVLIESSESTAFVEKELEYDDGGGYAIVWRMTSRGLDPVADNERGHFCDR
jgi:hypothetical protein